MYQKTKRILALLAVIIIALLYGAVLVLAFMKGEQANNIKGPLSTLSHDQLKDEKFEDFLDEDTKKILNSLEFA